MRRIDHRDWNTDKAKVKQLRDTYNMPYTAIAERLGYSVDNVRKMYSLATLDNKHDQKVPK